MDFESVKNSKFIITGMKNLLILFLLLSTSSFTDQVLSSNRLIGGVLVTGNDPRIKVEINNEVFGE